MVNKEKLRQRFLRDPLPVRLGGIAATLGRISSGARSAESPAPVAALLEEAKYLIEWTAAEADPYTAADLVQIQRLLVQWQKIWETAAATDKTQRVLLATLAKEWSDRTLQHSGLV